MAAELIMAELEGYGYRRERVRPVRYWWKWGIWVWQCVGIYSNGYIKWISSEPYASMAAQSARTMAEIKGVPYLDRLPRQ